MLESKIKAKMELQAKENEARKKFNENRELSKKRINDNF